MSRENVLRQQHIDAKSFPARGLEHSDLEKDPCGTHSPAPVRCTGVSGRHLPSPPGAMDTWGKDPGARYDGGVEPVASLPQTPPHEEPRSSQTAAAHGVRDGKR
ncbi:hypothetical protein GCM10009771_00030 [Nesterenkonia flava]